MYVYNTLQYKPKQNLNSKQNHAFLLCTGIFIVLDKKHKGALSVFFLALFIDPPIK